MPKKGKKKKDEPPPRKPTPFDDKPADELRAKLRDLKEALAKSQMDRNQMQVDRVSIPGALHSLLSFLCVSRKHSAME